MGMPGGTELLIILFIVLIIFGGGKLAGVGRSLGTAISEFKSSVSGEEKEEPEKAEPDVDHHSPTGAESK